MELRELIERLEKATGPDREIDLAISSTLNWKGVFGSHEWRWSVMADELVSDTGGCLDPAQFVPRWTASTDAAMTLVPDGLAWTLGQNVHHRYWQASVNNLDEDGRPQSIGYSGLKGDLTPALALCIAALKARQSSAH